MKSIFIIVTCLVLTAVAQRNELRKPYTLMNPVEKKQPSYDLSGESSNLKAYSNLIHDENLYDSLTNFNLLPLEKRGQLFSDLVGVCESSQIPQGKCRIQLQNSILDEKVFDYFVQYYPHSKRLSEELDPTGSSF